MNKAELRKVLIQTRRSLPQIEWQQRSQKICDQLVRSQLFQDSNTILSYCSFRQEPNLESLLTLPAKTWGLPRCIDQTLVWHQWTSEGLPLQIGAFGIREPHPDSPAIAPEQVDLILVPCVACDLQGYRLGYGGGFYDRLFSSSIWKNKPAIGIVFEFALLKQLEIDHWDQPLSAVCTEEKIIYL